MPINYKQAGVDVEKGDQLVSWLQQDKSESPHADKIVSGIGGFAALFRAQFNEMESPCLVSATDGVGTKVLLASQYQRYEGVGQDLVGMCVNDLICCGAQPLFFLDYFACGKLEMDMAQTFLKGLKQACQKSQCALIGGETAEMPGVYSNNDFDCAGFAVGVVDEKKVLGAHRVVIGDRLLALPSSGFHSNGYSLLRKVFEKDTLDWLNILMRPTRLYPEIVLPLIKEVEIKAMAHITGGGLDNVLRVIPEGMAVQLEPWQVPPEFLEVKKRAAMTWESLLKTLNCGLGMVMFVNSKDYDRLLKICGELNERVIDLGEVVGSQRKEWRLNEDHMEKVNS